MLVGVGRRESHRAYHEIYGPTRYITLVYLLDTALRTLEDCVGFGSFSGNFRVDLYDLIQNIESFVGVRAEVVCSTRVVAFALGCNM